MLRPVLAVSGVILIALGTTQPMTGEVAKPEQPGMTVGAFLQTHCIRCHGPEKKLGGIRLDDLKPEPGQDVERWQAVRDQIRDGLMPPLKQPRPDPSHARSVVVWISEKTDRGLAERMPNKGNLIPHELLFGKLTNPVVPPPERLWRLSPAGYTGWVQTVARGRPSVTQPFLLIPERGIKDYAGLYSIDEASTEILVRNAEAIVEAQTLHILKDGKPQGKNDTVREFVLLMDPALTPTRTQLEAAVQTQFRLAIGRSAGLDEVARFLDLYEKCAHGGDRPGAVKTMLQAVLLRTDAMFRMERIHRGESTGGPRPMAPEDLALAMSLTLTTQRDNSLMTAAQKGQLASREQVAEQVRRILDDPRMYEIKNTRSRLLPFFREYFEYDRALEVFKDKPADFLHSPATLVTDTDHLILHILSEDRDVLRELLTTQQSFVNRGTKQNKQTRRDDLIEAVIVNPNNDKGKKSPNHVYGFEQWPSKQPATLPEGQRRGILMQPSWLVAHSTNFDNDPVRRGRWIRERLLGGTVPDLPIGVAAQVPDDRDRTFRDRLTVTRDPMCWKCHVRMDDLGLPFEQYDHFGRFRRTESVEDPEATAKNVDKKGKNLGPIYRQAPLDTTGVIAESGDPRLDGPVKNPQEMLQRLADSERVRQVFIRHVFRYFLGRNETLSDARTLQEADRAYVTSGGSFRALLVSLLTSDSFLLRSPTKGDSK